MVGGYDDEAQVHAYVTTIREMIRHEDELVNQRLTWMWTLQGLLFGAAGVLWTRDWRGVAIISGVGLLSCVSIGYSLARGLRAIRELLALAAERKKGLEHAGALPPTIGSRTKAIEWLVPGHFLPWMFGLSWILTIAVRALNAAPGQ